MRASRLLLVVLCRALDRRYPAFASLHPDLVDGLQLEGRLIQTADPNLDERVAWIERVKEPRPTARAEGATVEARDLPAHLKRLGRPHRVHAERTAGLLSAIRAMATPDMHRFTANAVADSPAETSAGAYSCLGAHPTGESAKVVDSHTVALLPAIGSEVAPAVWAAAVRVGDAVCVSQLARAYDRARPPLSVAGPGEGGYASGDISRRLGDSESRAFLQGIAPVRLADAEVLQHFLRAQPAGCDTNGRDRAVLQLDGQAFHDSFDVGLDEVVIEPHVPAEVSIRLRGAVSHLNHEPAAS